MQSVINKLLTKTATDNKAATKIKHNETLTNRVWQENYWVILKMQSVQHLALQCLMSLIQCSHLLLMPTSSALVLAVADGFSWQLVKLLHTDHHSTSSNPQQAISLRTIQLLLYIKYYFGILYSLMLQSVITWRVFTILLQFLMTCHVQHHSAHTNIHNQLDWFTWVSQCALLLCHARSLCRRRDTRRRDTQKTCIAGATLGMYAACIRSYAGSILRLYAVGVQSYAACIPS